VDGTFVNQLNLANTDRMPLILSNHDSFAGDRPWNQLNGDVADYKLAAASYLLAAQTPFTYYGEEIGMANAASLSGDHALRTPMSWTSDPNNAGFSAVMPFRDLSANVSTNNVQDEQGDSDSLLEYYRSLYQLRRSYPLVANGTLDVQSNGGDRVLLLTRSGAGGSVVIAINYDSVASQAVAATGLAGASFDAIFGATGQLIADGGGNLALNVPARSAVVYFAQP
jgi:glycosidase